MFKWFKKPKKKEERAETDSYAINLTQMEEVMAAVQLIEKEFSYTKPIVGISVSKTTLAPMISLLLFPAGTDYTPGTPGQSLAIELKPEGIGWSARHTAGDVGFSTYDTDVITAIDELLDQIKRYTIQILALPVSLSRPKGR